MDSMSLEVSSGSGGGVGKKDVPEVGQANQRGSNNGGEEGGSLVAENEDLKKSLAESNAENIQLRQRFDHFLKAFPDFEELKRTLELEEEELMEVIRKLKISMEEVFQVMVKKEDEVASLTRRIDSLRLIERKREQTINLVGGSILEGEKEAISMLPEEMWKMVLDKLAYPKDLWNSSNTCGLFKKILQDWRKPTWLFMHAFPLLFKHLPRNKILECRLVSKGWNMVVDNFLENHATLRPYRKTVSDPRMLPLVSSAVEEKALDLTHKFDFRWGGFHCENPGFPYIPGRNPFLGRAVTLVIGSSNNTSFGDEHDEGHELLDMCYGYKLSWAELERCNNAFWGKVHSFLETFGKHIWYLTLDCSEGKLGAGRDPDFNYDGRMLQLLTVDLFCLAPNLRRLTVLPSEFEDYQNVAYIAESPLPVPSSSLETIQASCKNVRGDHWLLVALLKGHHGTLRVLKLNCYLWRMVCDLEWPNLAELHLRCNVDYLDLNKLLQAGGERMPMLARLGVSMEDISSNGLDLLLGVIHQFFGSTQLSTLRIYGGIPVRATALQKKKKNWKFCMSPRLKTLEVDYSLGEEFYTFLLRFPLVENVHLIRKASDIRGPSMGYSNPHPLPHFMYLASSDEEEREEEPEEGMTTGYEAAAEEIRSGKKLDLHKHLFQGKVYHSNLWKLLPRLKLFACGWDIYTRSGYEQFLEGKDKPY